MRAPSHGESGIGHRDEVGCEGGIGGVPEDLMGIRFRSRAGFEKASGQER
jgi:hypothetical protein